MGGCVNWSTPATLTALKEERKVLLAGRKVAELTKEEQFELAQNRNRTTWPRRTWKSKARLYEIESIEAVKTLLRKSRGRGERNCL